MSRTGKPNQRKKPMISPTNESKTPSQSPPEKAILELAKPVLTDAINVLHVLEPFADGEVPEEITLARKALKRVFKSLYH
jgi:hypothetical protein